jgi:hypothetical protein
LATYEKDEVSVSCIWRIGKSLTVRHCPLLVSCWTEAAWEVCARETRTRKRVAVEYMVLLLLAKVWNVKMGI